jgi:hypothetical protein
MVYEISHVHYGGYEVDLRSKINLIHFRAPIDKLTFVERKRPVRTSSPLSNPEPQLRFRRSAGAASMQSSKGI